MPPALSISQVAWPMNVSRASEALSAAGRRAAGSTALGACETARQRSTPCAPAGAARASAARRAARIDGRRRRRRMGFTSMAPGQDPRNLLLGGSIGRSVQIPAPLSLPDEAVVALRIAVLGRNNPRRRVEPGDLQQQLAPDG